MTINGFQNEDYIIIALNNMLFRNININLQKALLTIDPNISQDTLIKARKIGGQSKCDIQISISDKVYAISVKKGSGNSVHQETLEEFISFLKSTYGDNTEVFNAIRFFIWGDNTLDGTGDKTKRLSSTTIKMYYPAIMAIIQSYFDLHKIDLLRRFVIDGNQRSTVSIDYLYYGDVNTGKMINVADIMKIITPTKGQPAIGRLTFQAWNRNIKNNPKIENRRGVIQLKWGTLQKDIGL